MGLRGVNQQTGRVYREVGPTGVPVTVIDRDRPIAQIVPIHHDETWYERMVREGRVHQTAGEWALPTRRWGAPEGFDLEQFLLGEYKEDR